MLPESTFDEVLRFFVAPNRELSEPATALLAAVAPLFGCGTDVAAIQRRLLQPPFDDPDMLLATEAQVASLSAFFELLAHAGKMFPPELDLAVGRPANEDGDIATIKRAMFCAWAQTIPEDCPHEPYRKRRLAWVVQAGLTLGPVGLEDRVLVVRASKRRFKNNWTLPGHSVGPGEADNALQVAWNEALNTDSFFAAVREPIHVEWFIDISGEGLRTVYTPYLTATRYEGTARDLWGPGGKRERRWVSPEAFCDRKLGGTERFWPAQDPFAKRVRESLPKRSRRAGAPSTKNEHSLQEERLTIGIPEGMLHLPTRYVEPGDRTAQLAIALVVVASRSFFAGEDAVEPDDAIVWLPPCPLPPREEKRGRQPADTLPPEPNWAITPGLFDLQHPPAHWPGFQFLCECFTDIPSDSGHRVSLRKWLNSIVYLLFGVTINKDVRQPSWREVIQRLGDFEATLAPVVENRYGKVPWARPTGPATVASDLT